MKDNRLEDLREEYNYKSKEVAKTLIVSEATYSQWERNKIPIPTKRLIQLSNLYNTNIDYILLLTDTRKHIKTDDYIDLKLIGNRLKEIRKELGFSLRELGNNLNCAFSSLASYERGEVLIHCEILLNIAKLNNYSIDWILGRTDNKYIKSK